MPTVATGSLTIVDVNDGLSPYLTNDSIITPADAAGVVGSFVGAETQFKIIEGGVDVTNDWSYHVSGTGGGISYRDSNDTVDRTGTGEVDGALGGDNLVTYSEYNAATWVNALPAGATLTTGVADPFGGTSAVRFSTNGTAQALLRVNFPAFTANGTDSYTISAYVRRVSGSGTAFMDLYDGLPSASFASQLVTGAWVRVSITGVPAAGAKSWVDIYSNATSTQVLEYFGVTVTKGAAPSELSRTGGAIASGTRGYLKITALSQDLSYIDITATKFGRQPMSRRFSIAKARQGITGTDGSNGSRGTMQVSRAIAGTVWSDSEAATAISDAGGGSPMPGDLVTLYNSAAGFSNTRVRAANGTWTALAAFFGGNVLVDGTVAATKLVAGSITTDKLAVGAAGNYVWNPCFAYSDAGWSRGGTVASVILPALNDLPDWSLQGVGSGIFAPTADLPNNGYIEAIWWPDGSNSRSIPVRPGDKVAFQAAVLPKNGMRIRFVVYWFDDAGNSTLAQYGSPTLTNTTATDGKSLANYTRMTGMIGPAPAGTTRMQLGLRATNETGATIPSADFPFVAITQVGIAVVHPNATIVPDWAPGGMTSISGGVLRTQSIDARALSVGAVTTDKIEAGAITTSTIAADAVTANKLVLGDFSNRVEAPTFASGAASWGVWATGASGNFSGLPTGVAIVSNATNAYVGNEYMSFTAPASSVAPVDNVNVFPVTPGEIYLLRATARAVTTPNADLIVRLRFYAGNKSSIVQPATVGSGDLTFNRSTDTTYVTRRLVSSAVVVPVGAAWAVAEVVPANTMTSGEWRLGEVFVSRRNSSDLIVDGAISAEKIAARAVTATKIMVGEASNTYPDFDMLDSAFYSGDPFTFVPTSHSTMGQNRINVVADAVSRTVRSEWFTVEAVADYTISGVAYCTASALTTAQLQIEFGSLDAAGAVTSTRLVTVAAATTSSSVTRSTVAVLTGATERRARFVMSKSANATTAVGFGGFLVRRRASGELIVDGAITASKILAGAVTAEKLAVGSPANVIWNSCPGLGTDGWVAPTITGSGTTPVIFPTQGTAFDPTWVLGGYPGMALTAATLTSLSYVETAWAPDGYNSGSLPCLQGDVIEVQGLVLAALGQRVTIYARFLTSTGTQAGVGTLFSHDGAGPADGRTRARYARVGGKATAPANAVAALLVVRLQNSGPTTISNAFGVATQLSIGFGNVNQTELSAWAPGGITQVSGGVIRTGAMTARTLGVDSVTADKIQAGAVTASKLTITSNSVLTDGSFDDPIGAWTFDANGWVVQDNSGSNTAATMGLRRAVVLSSATFTGTTQKAISSRSFGSVSAGEVYHFQARGYSTGTNRLVALQLYAINSANALVGSVAQLTWSNEGPSDKQVLFTVPAGGVRMVVAIVAPSSMSNWAGTAAIGKITVADAVGQTRIVGGSITADKLAATNVITTAAQITDGVITRAKILDGEITNAKIETGAITRAKILDGEIVTAKIGDLQVNNIKIAGLAVNTGKIDYNAVTRTAEASAFNTVVYPGGKYPVGFQVACTVATAVQVETGGAVVILVKAALKESVNPAFGTGSPGEGASE